MGLAAGSLHAAEPAAAANWAGQQLDKCCGGGDIRIRQVYFDDLPIVADPPGVTRGGQNHFFRFRTRLWGQYDPMDNVTIYGRLANEFRHYEKPENNSANALDEIIVDQLYLSARDLLDGAVDVKIGRQEMIYGTGKLILEGTPKDGSRTIYFDAVRLTLKKIEKTSIDLFGIYNQPENELVLRSEDRDLTGYTAAYDDVTESGGGIYLKNSSLEALPCELYYIYKEESDWTQAARRDPVTGDPLPPRYAWQTLDAAAGIVENPELQLNTVGFRLMPKWPGGVEGSIEVAYQTGERGDVDVEGMMVDGVVKYKVPALEKNKPCLGAGVYYLSGDDSSTADDEGWNPLWARYPQYSELYVYAFDAEAAGRWSNVMMPHLDLNMAITEKIKAMAMVGYLSAPEENGPGGGDERGWLGVLRTDFTLKEGLLRKGDKQQDKLFGHLLVEVLEPGNYYNVEDTAIFTRWELSYAF